MERQHEAVLALERTLDKIAQDEKLQRKGVYHESRTGEANL
jgi:hypothetical protein